MSLSELLKWKDDTFALHALPLNMMSQLAIIASRLVRCKGEVLPPQQKALTLARAYITGEVVNGDSRPEHQSCPHSHSLSLIYESDSIGAIHSVRHSQPKSRR